MVAISFEIPKEIKINSMKNLIRNSAAILCCLSTVIFTSCDDDDDGTGTTPITESRNLYTMSNLTQNAVIHYSIQEDGSLQRSGDYPTMGQGTNGFKPVTGEASAPDPLFSADAVQLSEDNDLLFVCNAGDNSVSTFSIQDDGTPRFVDRKSTGQDGTVMSLAYNEDARVLTASHAFGPQHLTQFQVDEDGGLTLMPNTYTLNNLAGDDRIPTQIIHSPNRDFLIGVIVFDTRPMPGPDGPVLDLSNVDRKDGLVVFPVNTDGTLGQAQFRDAGAPTPFSLRFLNNNSSRLVCTYAAAVPGSAGNGAGLLELGSDGSISPFEFDSVDLSLAPEGPSETCWVAIDQNDEYAYVSNFSLGTVSSFRIDGTNLSIAEDPIVQIQGNGFAGLAGIPTSGPGDIWMDSDDRVYQLFANAALLIAFQANDGGLTEIGRYNVPLNSVQGLKGF